MTDNLFGVVESLLSDYVAREQGAQRAKSKAVEATVAIGNEFADQNGSYADEHSAL
jgi:antitoxin CcdA